MIADFDEDFRNVRCSSKSLLCVDYGVENRRIEVALNIVCVVGETPVTRDFDAETVPSR